MVYIEEYKKLQKMIQETDMAGEYQKLLALAKRYVDLADALFGRTDVQYATALNEYAGAYRNLGDYVKAEKVYHQALDIMKSEHGELTSEYATILNNLSGMYRLSKQYEKAEESFLAVKNIYEHTVGMQHFLYCSCLNNLGLLYQDMGEYGKAEELHQECLKLFEQKGNFNVAYATTLMNLASAKDGMGKLDEVESLLEKSMEIYEEKVGCKHPLYAHALNSLAAYYIKTEKYEQAKNCLEDTLAIVEAGYGKDSDSYTLIGRNLEAVEGLIQKIKAEKQEQIEVSA